MDEASDRNKDCFLMTYFRFIDGDDVREESLLCGVCVCVCGLGWGVARLWLESPFCRRVPTSVTGSVTPFSTSEEEEFVDATSDSTTRLQIQSKPLAAFWIGGETDYPPLAIPLPFAASFLSPHLRQNTDQSWT